MFMQLQSFMRDAEQLESLTASHEAFLDFDDLGVSSFSPRPLSVYTCILNMVISRLPVARQYIVDACKTYNWFIERCW